MDTLTLLIVASGLLIFVLIGSFIFPPPDPHKSSYDLFLEDQQRRLEEMHKRDMRK